MFFIFLCFFLYLVLLLLLFVVSLAPSMSIYIGETWVCFLFLFNQTSSFFFYLLLFLSVLINLYSFFYMSFEDNYRWYLFCYLLFVLTMVFLVMSSLGWGFLFFWDFLGITSFLLVIFYLSRDSVLGGVVICLTIRVGDICLILALASFLFSSFYACFFYIFVFMLFFFLSSLTKCAQFPFLGWLPLAMSAPTPVSALVHSSTLVTSGLLILWSLSFSGSFYLIFFLGILTLFISGSISLVEEDAKKLIALSTLSQISLCFLLSSFYLNEVSYCHILSHALVKSFLFLQVGYFIYTSLGQQDSRFFFFKYNTLPCFFSLVSLFGLCGVFFTGISLTKEQVLASLVESGSFYFICLLLFFSIFFTFLYSFRLLLSFLVFFSSFYVSCFMDTCFYIFFLYLGFLFFFRFIVINSVLTSSYFSSLACFSAVLYFLFFLFFYSILVGSRFFLFIVSFLTSYFFFLFSFIFPSFFFIEYLLSKFLIEYFLLLAYFRSFFFIFFISGRSIYLVGVLGSLFLFI